MISAVPCEVTLVEAPNLELVKRAWTLSRPNETDPDLDKILEIDIPVNEIPRVTVEMYVPILVREIVCTLRDHVVWARTSRVDDLTKWDIWEGIDVSLLEYLHREMMEAKEKGNDQDDYRMYIPLCYMTGFTLSLSLRTYMKLCCYFKSLYLEYEQWDKTVSDLFYQIYIKMKHVLPFGKIISLIEENKVKFDNLNQRPDSFGASAGYKKGGMIFFGVDISIAVRAQLVRHRALIVADNLVDYFSNIGLTKPISKRLYVQVSTTISIARNIISKRTCWIAQSDIWDPIVKEVSDILNLTDVPELPCSNGECPYKRDNELRMEGKDPGLPCPRFAVLYDTPYIAWRWKAREYCRKRTSFPYWLDQINQAIQKEKALLPEEDEELPMRRDGYSASHNEEENLCVHGLDPHLCGKCSTGLEVK